MKIQAEDFAMSALRGLGVGVMALAPLLVLSLVLEELGASWPAASEGGIAGRAIFALVASAIYGVVAPHLSFMRSFGGALAYAWGVWVVSFEGWRPLVNCFALSDPPQVLSGMAWIGVYALWAWVLSEGYQALKPSLAETPATTFDL